MPSEQEPESETSTALTIAREPASMGSSLRLGVIGSELGRARYGAALASLRDITVTGVMDSDIAAAKVWARQIGGRTPFYDRLTSLCEMSPPPQALLIAAPLEMRSTLITEALPLVPFLLCEPPFAPTLSETDRLLRLAEEHHALLMPALTRPLDPRFQEAERWITSGRLGEIRQIRCDWSLPLESSGAFDTVEESDGEWLELLRTVFMQTANVCLGWLGAFQTVSADIDFPPAETRRPDVSLLANIILAQERSQSTHHFVRSRARQPVERYLLSGSEGQLELTVSAGERASSAQSMPSLFFLRPGQRPEPACMEESDPVIASLPLSPGRIRRLLQHFSACVRGTEQPLVTGADLRSAQEVYLAALLSAREDVKVPLPLQRYE